MRETIMTNGPASLRAVLLKCVADGLYAAMGLLLAASNGLGHVCDWATEAATAAGATWPEEDAA